MAAPYVCIRRTNVCDDDHASLADVTLVGDEIKEYQTTLVKSLKVSSLQERKCPQSYNPSRIVELLKYLATITTWTRGTS